MQGFRPISILMYHQVEQPAARGSAMRGLCVAPNDFRRQMALLHGLGYQGLSVSALQPYLRGEKQGKVFGISFDDGYLNNLEHALPVLSAFGFSATCYVLSAHLGLSNSWDHSKGVVPKPLMNAQQLQQWVVAGQEVGSHGVDHVDLTTLDGAAAQQQIAGSKVALEQLLQRPVTQYCYPYGHYTSEHAALVQAAGYSAATTTGRGRVLKPLDADGSGAWFSLPRVPVWRATTRAALWWKLTSRYEDRKAARR